MTTRSEGLAQLAAIMSDETAHRDVRDSAKVCRDALAAHKAPPRDAMEVVTWWVAKRQKQDKYGK